MYLKAIWRYPGKSMAGEPLQTAHLTALGIQGDRILQVQVRTPGRRARTITARTHPRLLGLRASLNGNPPNSPRINGKPWDDPSILALVKEIAGHDAELIADQDAHQNVYQKPGRFDVLPLLIATDGAIAEFGRDQRRLRPNLVIGGVTGLDERQWQGGQLWIGDVRIQIEDLRSRCIMTTFDPDTQAADPRVLRDIVDRFAGKLALNCAVITGGDIESGQEVRLVHSQA